MAMRISNMALAVRFPLRLVSWPLAFAALVLPSLVPAADCIWPTDEVVNGVILRAGPTTGSARRGALLPGDSLPLVASVPHWYETRAPDGQPAFASKRWVVAEDCTQGPLPPVAPLGAGPTFTIDVFDVGTGLSVLTRGPDFSLLYDAGSNDDFGTGEDNRTVAYIRAVAPTLTHLGHVVLSHPHKDHVELLPDVVSQFPPGDVWDSGSRGNMTCGYWTFLQTVALNPAIRYHTVTQDSGMEPVALKAGECASAQLRTLTIRHSSRIVSLPLPLGTDAKMEFLYADGTSYTSSQDPNRNSLVVRLTLGNKRVMFMGDAPGGGRTVPSQPPAAQSIEWKLLQCCAQDLFADVLIVGHHGSMTSSRGAFIDAVGASIFVISSGPKKYGSLQLPDEAIVQALKLRGTVLETNTNDVQCASAPAKVGPDGDGKPGGCDAIRITIPSSGPILSDYNRPTD